MIDPMDLHKIFKKAGMVASKKYTTAIIGYHKRTYGYYLEAEKRENPNWGINSSRRSQAGRWQRTGRVIIYHTEGHLGHFAKLLEEAGLPYQVEENRIIVGEL